MRTVLNFNRKWAFSKQACEVPTKMPKDWIFVNLPHTWNAIDGQDGGNDYYRGTCYYAKSFEKHELPENELYYLEINGANSSAAVYLNGQRLAEHHGGYSTWRVNLTNAMAEHNLLVIEVDNSANGSVYPQNADFTFYGGLYRDVNIIAVSKTHFDLDYYGAPGFKITPFIEGGDAKLSMEAFVTDPKPGQRINITVFDKENNAVACAQMPAEETFAELKIKNVHLWQGRKDPYLYRAEACIMDNDAALDMVSARFGCRSFNIDPEKGFFLNGKSYPLRGVSRHQDWWGIGNALLPEHHQQDAQLIYELGATTIRLAHYQHDQYFYDLCDEMGFVVWAEIPYISNHLQNGTENTVSQMKELISQNYNHPSIVVWGLSNEITMAGKSNDGLIQNHLTLNALVHKMDPNRLTTLAVVSMCDIHDPYIQIPDVVSFNHYFGWYGGDTSMNGPWFDNFHKHYPHKAVGVSEYGCEALNWHTSNPVQGDYTEEYQAYYHEELIKQLYTRDYLWATHVWNMFDFGADARAEGGENGQNHKGLVTFDRKYKKDAFYAYKAWLSDEKFVHICGKRYIDRAEDVTRVTVYSNQPQVELFANGQSLGVQKSDVHFFYFDVPLSAQTRIVAVAEDCSDESIIRKVDKFNEDYRLKEKGAVLNWFDITEPKGYFSLNDKLSDIMASPEGKKLFDEIAAKIAIAMKQNGTVAAMGDSLEMGEGMMKMMGGFTLLRLTSMLSMMNLNFSKEELLELNARLNKINK